MNCELSLLLKLVQLRLVHLLTNLIETGVRSSMVVTLSKKAETIPAKAHIMKIRGHALPLASLYICVDVSVWVRERESE